MRYKVTVKSNFRIVNILGIIAFFLLMLLALSNIGRAEEVEFSDFDKQNQAWPYAKYLIDRNIISGYPDGTFRPEEPATRAELAIMLVKQKNMEPLTSQNPSFIDVPQDHFAYSYIQALAEEKYVSGYHDKTFKPGQNISRAELATLFFRYFDRKPGQLIERNIVDLPKNHWAYKQVVAAVDAGILDLKEGKVEPDQPATRARLVFALAVGEMNKQQIQDESIVKGAQVLTYAVLDPFGVPSFGVKGEGHSIVFSDTQNHKLEVIGSYKVVSTLAGKSTGKDEYGMPIGGYKDGTATGAMFAAPKGIAHDGHGTFYVADSENGAIRTVDWKGNVKTFVKGLNNPIGIALGANGEIYVAETLNHRILKIDAQGKWTVLAGGGYKVENGEPVGTFADGKGESAQFNEPQGLAIDDEGYLYVADTGNQRIRKVSPDGVVTTLAGSENDLIDRTSYVEVGYQDGDGKTARFNFPVGLAVGKDKTVYVADSLNHCIRVISPEGKVSTLAGAVVPGRVDGRASLAHFNTPTDILLWENGSILIIDQGNSLIRQYIPNK